MSKLLSGVEDILICYGVELNDIDVVWVLGVFEILFVVKKMVEMKKYDVVIIFGMVIRGVIMYYDYVCNEVVKGIVQVGMVMGVLVIFGIVMIEIIEQVIECVGIKVGNKGVDCVVFVIEMVNLNCLFE